MKLRNAVVMGLALAPLSAIAAEGLNYTYLQVDYLNLDIDDVGDDDGVIDDFDNGNGYAIRGSYAFTENWFVFADYSSTDSDVSFFDDTGVRRPANTDVKIVDVGAGYALPLDQNAHAVFRLAYTDADIDDFDLGGSSTISVSDLDDDTSDGFFADASWRGQVASQWEIMAGVRYTDIGDIDGISFVGNAIWEYDENWGIVLSVDAGDELGTYSAGVRYSFN